MKLSFKQYDRVVCADGFTMSVQASEYSYSEPRTNDAQRYTAVEIGFPSEKEDVILEWAEDPKNPEDTVYPYVPSHVVASVCAKHGGIVEGELPPGIARLEAVNVH